MRERVTVPPADFKNLSASINGDKVAVAVSDVGRNGVSAEFEPHDALEFGVRLANMALLVILGRERLDDLVTDKAAKGSIVFNVTPRDDEVGVAIFDGVGGRSSIEWMSAKCAFSWALALAHECLNEMQRRPLSESFNAESEVKANG